MAFWDDVVRAERSEPVRMGRARVIVDRDKQTISYEMVGDYNDAGGPRRVGSIGKVNEQAARTGIRRVGVFDPSDPGWTFLVNRPRTGAARYKYIEDASEAWNRYVRETLGLKGAAGVVTRDDIDLSTAMMPEFERRYSRMATDPVTGQQVRHATAIFSLEGGRGSAFSFQIRRPDGTYQQAPWESINDFQKAYGRTMMMSWDATLGDEGDWGLGKLFKRARGVGSERVLEISEKNSPFTVAVFDPSNDAWVDRALQHGVANHLPEGARIAHAKQVTKQASDGLIRAGKGVFIRFRDEAYKDAKRWESDAKALARMGQHDKARASLAQAARVRAQADDLARQIQTDKIQTYYGQMGGLKKVKGMVDPFAALGMDPTTEGDLGRVGVDFKSAAEEVDGILKGRYIYDPRLGANEMVASADSISNQERFLSKNFWAYLMPDHRGANPKLSTQVFTSHPGLFDPDYIYDEWMTPMVRAEIESVLGGQAPSRMIRNLIDKRNQTLPKRYGETAEEIARREYDLERRAFGDAILERHAAGIPLTESPSLMKRAIKQIHEHYQGKEFGDPNVGKREPLMKIPISMEAPIITDPFMEEELYRGMSRIMYDRSSQAWVINDLSFSRLYLPTGGGDLDDVLVNMLRWFEDPDDPTKSRIVTPTIRNPTGPGETMMAWMRAEDSPLAEILDEHINELPTTDRYKQLHMQKDDLRGWIRELMEEKSGLDEDDFDLERVREELDDANKQLKEVVRKMDETLSDPDYLSTRLKGITLEEMRATPSLGFDDQGRWTVNLAEPNAQGRIVGSHPLSRFWDPALEEARKLEGRPAGPTVSNIELDPAAYWRAIKRAPISDTLGTAMNAGMVLDSFLSASNLTEDEITRATSLLGDEGFFTMLREDLIDEATQKGQSVAKITDTLVGKQVAAMVALRRAKIGVRDVGGVESFGLSREFLASRGNVVRQYLRDEITRTNNLPGAEELSLDRDFIMHDEDPRNVYQRAVEGSRSLSALTDEAVQESMAQAAGIHDAHFMTHDVGDRARWQSKQLWAALQEARIMNHGADTIERNEAMNRAFWQKALELGMFEDGVESDNLYRAMMAMLQRVSSETSDAALDVAGPHASVSALSNRVRLMGAHVARGASWEEAANLIDPEELQPDASLREILEETMRPVTTTDVVREIGSDARITRQAMDEISRMLLQADEPVTTLDAMNYMTKGARRAGERALDELPEAARTMLPDMGADKILRGPLDPALEVSLPGRDRPLYLVQAIHEIMDAGGVGAAPQGMVDSVLGRMLEAHRGLMDVATSGDPLVQDWLPSDIRNAATYAAQAQMDPGEAARARSERVQQMARRVVGDPDTADPYRRATMSGLSDLMDNPLARRGAIGAGLMAAVGIVSMARRDRTRTVDEMQGPEALPGGNPYNDEPREPVPPPPPRPPAPSGGGVSYEVRARGARGSQREASLWDLVGEVTGGRVTATKYESTPRDGGYERAMETYR